MKKEIFKSKKATWLLSLLIILGFAACKKEHANLIGNSGAPTVTSVHTVSKSTNPNGTTSITTYNSAGVATTTTTSNNNTVVSAFDSVTTLGKGGTLYQIVGTNLASATSVSFNGVNAYFNAALVSDKSIIVAVPTTAPFDSNQKAALVVKTLHGSATFKFSIQQPPPTILSFTPVAAAAGDTITITGSVLDQASAVMFGTTPAKIVSNTSTQIKVLLPAGIVQAFITVTTAGGTGTSPTSFGYKYLIYDDALTIGWGGNGGGYSGYNCTIDFGNKAFAERGTNSIQVVYTNSYGALQIGYGGSAAPDVTALGLKSIKFFVYGGPGIKTGDQIQVVINGNYGSGYLINLVAGAYTSYTIPLSALGNPQGPITEIVLQGFGVANPSTIYVDDIGFI